MQAFDQAVGLGVIRGCHAVVDAPCIEELGPNCGSKLTSSVGRYGLWDAE